MFGNNQPKIILLVVLVLVFGAIFTIVKRPPSLGLDLSGGTRLTLEAVPPAGQTAVTEKTMDALYFTIEKRVNGMGVSEAIVQKSGASRLIVEIPGEQDTERAKARIGKTGLLEFKRLVNGEWQSSGVSGRDLSAADVSTDGGNGWVVSFQLNAEGAEKFRKLTESLVTQHEPLGIFFDNEMQSAPVVQSVIPNGSGQISGKFTFEEAKLMVDTLNAGALPVDIRFMEENLVGPLLGKASIEQSLSAGIAGIILVIGFMLFNYRLPGLIANIALVIYTLLTYTAYNWLGVTYTLAGIAGFILSIGMAVDANILISERIKEEIRFGRALPIAMSVGFDRAFPSILDSNSTTLITCTLLWALGTGAVKGFAITLAIGVLISMFTAITVTRSLLQLMVSNEGTALDTAWFGVPKAAITGKARPA